MLNIFFDCTDLTSVIIPSTITHMGNLCFSGCNNIEHFFCYAENPINNPRIFSADEVGNAILHVPAASISSYQSTDPWKYFKEIVALTNDDPKPTGIMTIETSSNDNYIIYNLNGVRQFEPKKGINIVNGKKYVVK